MQRSRRKVVAETIAKIGAALVPTLGVLSARGEIVKGVPRAPVSAPTPSTP